MSARHAALLLCCAAASCADAPADDPGVFIPLTRDFAGFRAWPRVSLGTLSAGGHPEGAAQHVYFNRPLRAGSRRFDDGTILVRTFEQGDPSMWSIHAMARRGGDYNARGDVGWEFFLLRLTADGDVVIVARGLDPRTGREDAYSLGDGVGCNSCHGTVDARDYDGVLSLALRPPDP